MNFSSPQHRAREEAYEQSAVWLARLRSGEASQAELDEFHLWLNRSPLHQSAFDTMTTRWELAGSLHDIPRGPVNRYSRRMVLAGACAVSAAGGAALYVATRERPAVYSSDVGELRRVTLADGSRMVLDTSSVVDVVLTAHKRHLTLVSGRTYVEVAKDPLRPFIVAAGDHQVIARGTAFDVALNGGEMQVLLTEGLVDVVSKSGERNALVPGQRLTYAQGGIHIDEPDQHQLLAWQTGRLIFDNDTLANAVAQMNRYDRRKIVLSDAGLAFYRVSGTYTAGNTLLFAQSISQLLGIRVTASDSQIVISRGSGSPA